MGLDTGHRVEGRGKPISAATQDLTEAFHGRMEVETSL